MTQLADEIIFTTTLTIESKWLKRKVQVDCYHPIHLPVTGTELMLINDGQDLTDMDFPAILQAFHQSYKEVACIYAGIHCSDDRKNEYGTAGKLDYAGRGTSAAAYQQAILLEVIPAIRMRFQQFAINHCGIAGFSLGGLSAIDLAWNHPTTFSFCGVFSGSLWWRDVDQIDPSFDEHINRIIHHKIRLSPYQPGLRFFFEAGQLDEKADRNNNGIIDSIDDTLDLIKILKEKGYENEHTINYLELAEGKHDVTTWGVAFPYFLQWLFLNKA
jgi:enterochelin esterase-like enzyme